MTADNSEQEPKKRYIGKITGINKTRGYGFISSKEIPFTRIFFHWTGLLNETINFLELEKGMEVEFETTEFPDKGTRATRIDVFESKENTNASNMETPTEGSTTKLD